MFSDQAYKNVFHLLRNLLNKVVVVPEAVARKSYVKKTFLEISQNSQEKISQNSQENICQTLAQVFSCEFC